MLLVDTSVWIDHLRTGSPTLAEHLTHGNVLGHPWVTGELALGNLAQREAILGLLASLPQAITATPEEILTLIETHAFNGVGIGYVDAQLIASARLTADATLWTLDKRLAKVAHGLGIAV